MVEKSEDCHHREVWDDRWTAGRTGVDGLRVDRK